jgi:hypothetical protein
LRCRRTTAYVVSPGAHQRRPGDLAARTLQGDQRSWPRVLEPYSALDDIPGLPPFDPDTVDIEPSGFDLIWDFVRGIFGRRPHDRAA